jgi:hypothetical protein
MIGVMLTPVYVPPTVYGALHTCSDSAGLAVDRHNTRAADALELRGVRLPEREHLDRILEVALESAVNPVRCKHLTEVSADHEEAEVGALFQANSALNERAVFPR